MFTDACYCYLSIERQDEARALAERELKNDTISNLHKADYLCVLGLILQVYHS